MSPEFGLSWSNRLAEAPMFWLGMMIIMGMVGMILKSIDNAIP